MSKERRLKILGLSEKEVRDIKREVLKEVDSKKHTDSYLDFSETSVEHFYLCTKLLIEAKELVNRDRMEDAQYIIERCIFKLNTSQPEIYQLAAEIIKDKEKLQKIISYYEENEYLFEAEKLAYPIRAIKARCDHDLTLGGLGIKNVYSFVSDNPGINKTSLLSMLIKEYGWYQHEAESYITSSISEGFVKREKLGAAYQHFIN